MQDASPQLTPMFRQYRTLKADHADAILLFRMGDFYEMFYDDAQDASRLLELTLTARGKGTENVTPMCGFPHHQVDSYTAKLVRAGRRVAICEQMEDPRKVKGLVKREVIRVVTPGTVTDPAQLEAKANAWAVAVAQVGAAVGAAFLDASTGEFLAWQSGPDADAWQQLAERIEAFAPREIVHGEGFPWPEAQKRQCAARGVLTETDAFSFAPPSAESLLKRHFGVATLDGFGLAGRSAAIAAAGGLFTYLQETQKSGLQHIDGIALHEPSRSLLIDPASRRNLEIDRSIRDGGRKGSLLDVIDETVTSGGGRLQARLLTAPLLDVAEIDARLSALEAFVREPGVRRAVREELGRTHDLERLLAKAVARTAAPRDLVALRATLERLPGMAASLARIEAPLVRTTFAGLDHCPDVAGRLAQALVDEPPASIRDGGVIRDGFHPELDELRALGRDGRTYIAALEAREKEATGIASLKVRYNKVFGYYLEVSKANLHLVPAHFRRKQTIAGGERYVTDDLQQHESKVLHAQERIEELELELFSALRDEVARAAPRLKAVARALALLDVWTAWAELASGRGWTRPRVASDGSLRIAGGRHPVVEATLVDARFQPNDTELDAAGRAIAILTGPNMGGKSTYLRQVALIVLLAQAGSFVPADEAHVGVVDRIFCRVGASDSLAEGQSTFMVEMSETANILHHAGGRSLVLLDEIGRGTSTFDGLSIAWAVAEFLHERKGGSPRTLFATHYHELTELAVELPKVLNLRMAVRESAAGVAFLHKVEPGAADRSYGIQVARLAGVPGPVLQRAREILTNLERDEFGKDGLPRRARKSSRRPANGATQAHLFAAAEPAPAEEPPDPAVEEVLAELRTQDPNQLTPLDALQLLARWKSRLGPKG